MTLDLCGWEIGPDLEERLLALGFIWDENSQEKGFIFKSENKEEVESLIAESAKIIVKHVAYHDIDIAQISSGRIVSAFNLSVQPECSKCGFKTRFSDNFCSQCGGAVVKPDCDIEIDKIIDSAMN